MKTQETFGHRSKKEFTRYISGLISAANNPFKQAYQDASKKISFAIQHQSYADLAELMSAVRQLSSSYDVLTRHDLENAFNRMTPQHVIQAAAILDDDGPQRAMLFLLGLEHGRGEHIWRLFRRFIDKNYKPISHE